MVKLVPGSPDVTTSILSPGYRIPTEATQSDDWISLPPSILMTFILKSCSAMFTPEVALSYVSQSMD